MKTQTIFQAGNSMVVSIPKHIAKEHNLRIGQKVTVKSLDDHNLIAISPIKKAQQKPSKRATDAEFQSWLAMALNEDKELLNDLATR